MIEEIETRNTVAGDLPLQVSWGCAAAREVGGIATAIAEADRGLYGDKKA